MARSCLYSFCHHSHNINIPNFCFVREGNPHTITTDNGLQFKSSGFANFMKESGIRYIRTSVYRPLANRCAECFKIMLKDSLQTAQVTHCPWKPVVIEMLDSYRATPHATAGESPFQLLKGRSMWTNLNILPPPDDAGKYTHVRTRVASQQIKSKRYTDSRQGSRTSWACIGAEVSMPFSLSWEI